MTLFVYLHADIQKSKDAHLHKRKYVVSDCARRKNVQSTFYLYVYLYIEETGFIHKRKDDANVL